MTHQPTVSVRSLEQQRKRAKDLLRAQRRGDEAAAERFRAQHPPSGERSRQEVLEAELRLHDAQWVIAREAGFASWAALKRYLDVLQSSEGQAEGLLLQAAVAGDGARVDWLLGSYPQLAARSVHAAAVLADVEAVRVHLERSPDCATEPGGPLQWGPLLFACSARYGAGDGAHEARRVEVAGALLAAGADPSEGTRESASRRGYQSCVGAAVGAARSPALVKVLLDAGADRGDGPTLHAGTALWEAVRHRDLESLELLLEAGPPHWQIHHTLPQALNSDALELLDTILEHGANPNWTKGHWGFTGSCLHEAVARGMDAGLIDRLIEADARVDFRDRDGRTALTWAVRLGHAALAARLRAHGAAEELQALDHWMAACFAGDAARASELAPELSRDAMKRSDHQLLSRAVRLGRGDAAHLLLVLCDPRVPDDDGATALHRAVRAGDAPLVEALVAAGADPAQRDYHGDDAHAHARALQQPEREAISALLGAEPQEPDTAVDAAELTAAFEDAADAIPRGDLERLRELLARHPQLVHARSPRPHRATLLHYVGANGVESERQRTPPNAVEVLQLLLDAGSDVDAGCLTYGGGPEETTFGLLVTSAHPRSAGLTMPLVHALARAGAAMSDPWPLLVAIHEACLGHSVAEARARLQAAAPELAGACLIEAATLGLTDVVARLLDWGVPVGLLSRQQGATALHHAAFCGERETVELLLSRGADPTLRDTTYGGPAAGWAREGGHTELADYLASLL
ncbi:MAG: ankyrin repeat domain-containing protein [Myxococcales bacterium]|nr:ankyrin repeat domain-containing protein [Myxococcales bacterium]